MASVIIYVSEAESTDGVPHLVFRDEDSEESLAHFRRDPNRVMNVTDVREQIVVWELERKKHGLCVWVAVPEATCALDNLLNGLTSSTHFVRGIT
jgi:hypothetical protein